LLSSCAYSHHGITGTRHVNALSYSHSADSKYQPRYKDRPSLKQTIIFAL